MQDVLGGVDIPVMPVAALWACPLPERQVLGLCILIAAVVAQLAAGVESAHLNQLLMLPGSLVFQLPDQLSPRGVGNRLGQFAWFASVVCGVMKPACCCLWQWRAVDGGTNKTTSSTRPKRARKSSMPHPFLVVRSREGG